MVRGSITLARVIKPQLIHLVMMTHIISSEPTDPTMRSLSIAISTAVTSALVHPLVLIDTWQTVQVTL
jgi:hypothetical protein